MGQERKFAAENLGIRTVVVEKGAQVCWIELALLAVRPENDRERVGEIVRARFEDRVLTARFPGQCTNIWVPGISYVACTSGRWTYEFSSARLTSAM